MRLYSINLEDHLKITEASNGPKNLNLVIEGLLRTLQRMENELIFSKDPRQGYLTTKP
jgi:protein-arginine kinase